MAPRRADNPYVPLIELWRLARRGLQLSSYVAVQEGVQPVALPAVSAAMRAGWATQSDLDALTALWSARDESARERLAKRFRTGKRCFALFEGQDIPAATRTTSMRLASPQGKAGYPLAPGVPAGDALSAVVAHVHAAPLPVRGLVEAAG